MKRKSTAEIYKFWGPRMIDALELTRLGRRRTSKGQFSKVKEVREVWVEAPLEKEWIAAYRLVVQGGQPVVAEIRVFPREPETNIGPGHWSADVLGSEASAPPGGISARLLRKLKVGVHNRFAVEQVRLFTKLFGADIFFDLATIPAPPNRKKKGQRGRRPLDKIVYARLARDYATAARTHSKPIVVVAEKHGLPTSVVRDRVHIARDRHKFLTTTKQGRKGGVLTPAALEILRGTKRSTKRRAKSAKRKRRRA